MTANRVLNRLVQYKNRSRSACAGGSGVGGKGEWQKGSGAKQPIEVDRREHKVSRIYLTSTNWFVEALIT